MKREIKKQLSEQKKRALRELGQSNAAKYLIKSIYAWEEYKKTEEYKQQVEPYKKL